jgi:phenylalanyl-tRNA synthetase beta chain
MKASYEWIKELAPELKANAAAVERRLNASGTAVDGAERIAEGLEGVVVGEVRAVEAHPKADKLKVTQVFDGKTTHTVVCGAPNVEAGQKVPFAPVGTTLPNGLTLEARAIRSVESAGMICSSEELGLALESDGIMVLGRRLKPGRPFAEALKIRDVIYDLDVTPNRSDLLSHFGLARELAALFEVAAPKVSVRVPASRKKVGDAVTLEVSDGTRCPLYAGRVIEGVRIGPSPEWVQRRLLALGQRPVSNVVDATNLVLLQFGQPLHAFDLDRLKGAHVGVRRAANGEAIRLLDGSEIRLSDDDLVITDAEAPVALAGVMGGLDSEVHDGTTRLMLESAQFAAPGVRRTAKRHGLHTEASHRFERGVDPAMVQVALDACANLIVELAGGEVCSGRVSVDARSHDRAPISIRPSRTELLLGRPVGRTEIRRTLSRLGLRAVPKKSKPKGRAPAESMDFTVPSWRHDLSREVDLIEEVARVAGYDQIPTAMPAQSTAVRSKAFRRPAERRLRLALSGLGFWETVSLGFASPRDGDRFGVDARRLVGIRNPLGEETRYLRFSLVPSLLAAARRNQDGLPSVTDLRFFELGRTFLWPESPAEVPVETPRLCLLLRGRRTPRSWSEAEAAADVRDLVGALEATFHRLGVPMPSIERAERPWLHPRAAGQLVSPSGSIGVFGQVHPDVLDAYELEGPPVFVAEIATSIFEAEHPPRTFSALGAFPPAQRDLSFFVDRERPAGTILEAIREAGAPHQLETVELFDVYEGKGVPEGQRSLAVALVFRSPDHTLTEPEVEAAQAAIVDALEQKFGAVLRSGS